MVGGGSLVGGGWRGGRWVLTKKKERGSTPEIRIEQRGWGTAGTRAEVRSHVWDLCPLPLSLSTRVSKEHTCAATVVGCQPFWRTLKLAGAGKTDTRRRRIRLIRTPLDASWPGRSAGHHPHRVLRQKTHVNQLKPCYQCRFAVTSEQIGVSRWRLSACHGTAQLLPFSQFFPSSGPPPSPAIFKFSLSLFLYYFLFFKHFHLYIPSAVSLNVTRYAQSNQHTHTDRNFCVDFSINSDVAHFPKFDTRLR